MIQITMTNGTYICWEKEQYTDYIGRYSDRQKKEEAL